MTKPRSEDSCSRLITKLRRLGGLFALFFLLLLATLHWISQDIRGVAATALGSEAFAAPRLAPRPENGYGMIASDSLMPGLKARAHLWREQWDAGMLRSVHNFGLGVDQ